MLGLEIIHLRPEKSNGYPPLLFIHGEFHGAWSFQEHFLPFFAEQGFECIVPSLRGHGRSRLVDLQKVRFRDYVSDIAQVIKLLQQVPILVGHSMGAVVAQGYAQYHDVPGMVLLTPLCAVNAAHAWHAKWHFAKRHFLSFLEMQFLKRPHALIKNPERCRTSFFGKSMPQEKVDLYFQKLQDESIPVLRQIYNRNLFTQPLRTGFPCLLLEAENDTIVHPLDIEYFTSLYRADRELIPHIAHDVMLDVHWQVAATKILSWILKTFEPHAPPESFS